jgi:glycosyltransferase involved in cell wall biosynthesis
MNWELWGSGDVDAALDLTRAIGSSKRLHARPHLLVVIPWLIHGGSEVLLFDILSKLHLTWEIVIVTTIPARHVMSDQFRSVAKHIYHLGDIFDPIRTQAFIAGLISAFEAKVVLSSNSALHFEALPELKAMAPATKFFDILHNDLAHGYIRSAVRVSTSLTSHIAISRRIERSLVARGVPNERIVVIENGIDTSLFRPSEEGRASSRAAFGIAPEVIHLAFVGRLSDEKRVGAFLDIVSLVRAELPTAATLIGDGPQLEEVQERIRTEDLPITLKPRMGRADLVELYRAADLLVITSTVEGMPLVALEALASGCPVAATDVGDLRRIIGQSGFLVPVDEPERLAGLIVQSAKSADGHLARLRERARVTVLQAGMDRQLMLDKYKDLLAGTLPAPTRLP